MPVKIITYTNVLIYLWVVFAFYNGVENLLYTEQWPGGEENRYVFIGLLIVAIIFTIVSAIGLIVKKEWGRKFSVIWNFSLAFIVGVLPVSSTLLAYRFNMDEVSFSCESLVGVVVAVFLVVHSLLLRRSKVKSYFNGR